MASTGAAVAVGCAPVTAVFGGVVRATDGRHRQAIVATKDDGAMLQAVNACADTARGIAVGAALPFIAVNSIVHRDGPLARRIHDRTIMPLRRLGRLAEARDHVNRLRLPTDAIARDCETRVADELQRYADLPAMPNLSETPLVRPHWLLRRLTGRRWEFPETEEDANAFNHFQWRIMRTGEYLNAMARPGPVQRVDALVDAMCRSSALRGTCFAIAADALTNCTDRVALALNNMEAALVDWKAETGQFSMQDLYASGVDRFKLHVLDEIATTQIRLLHMYFDPDDVEVRLAYTTALADRLGLPGVVRKMRHRGASHVSERDINEAESEVRMRLAGNDHNDWLAQWRPWCKALERTHPDEFAALRAKNSLASDALVIAPEDMNDQQWIEALEEVARQKEKTTTALARTLTIRFRADNPISNAEVFRPAS